MDEAHAAVALVHARGPVEAILLIRRAERETDPWSGHWSFPGGRRDPADADLLDTALRELQEECGIRLARETLEAAMPPTTAGRAVGRHMIVAPFVFLIDSQLPTVLDPREVADAVWVPVNVLTDPLRHAVQSVPGMPKEQQFPGIELNGVALWGFTYRLLTEWLAGSRGA